MKKLKKNLEQLLGRSIDYYKNELKKRYNDFDFKKNKKVVLFGAAEMGKIYAQEIKKNDIKVLAVCDNDKSKHGKNLSGINIISPKTLAGNFSKETPIIITSIYEREIKQQLGELGFTNVWDFKYFSIFHSKNIVNPHWLDSIKPILDNGLKIIKVFDLLEDDLSRETYYNIIRYRLLFDYKALEITVRPKEEEYFDKKIIGLIEQEIFVDAGAYDGDTVVNFLKASRRKFKQIYAFEPDSHTLAVLRKKILNINDKRIRVLPYGLGKKNMKVSFSNEGTLGSRIDGEARKMVKIVRLDDIMEKASFLKFDIEGAETDALLGAKKIIKYSSPKLAICIYHKPTDLWEISLMIKRMNPSYKFFVRHYTEFLYDTVLYAV